MATKKKSDSAGSPKPNRDQRRREKFGGAGPVGREQPNQWPESQSNPALGTGGGTGDAVAGRQDQDQTDMTGAGAGGATEKDTRKPEVQGGNPGSRPNG
jgi:hypothetical protein